MKKLLALLTAALLLASCGGSGKKIDANTAADEKNGFKDIKLESSFEEVSSKVRNLLPSSLNEGVYFVADSTYYKLGDSKLGGLRLLFYNNKLACIYILGFKDDVLAALKQLYGDVGYDAPAYYWEGEKVMVAYEDGRLKYRYPFGVSLLEYNDKEIRSLLLGEEIVYKSAKEKRPVEIYCSVAIYSKDLDDAYKADQKKKREAKEHQRTQSAASDL